MALAAGDLFFAANVKRSICLMTGQTANNNAPTLVTDGFTAYPDNNIYATASGAFNAVEYPDQAVLTIRSTAGSGTMVGTFTIWGYLVASGRWYPVKVNGGSALAEYSADLIAYTETFTQLGAFDRLYLELSSVGGTATAFEAFLTVGRVGGA